MTPRLLPVSRVLLWALGVALVLLSGWSLMRGDVSVAFLSVAAIAYAAYALSGVVFPSWRMYADVVVRCDGDTVALTFDDGPHPVTTRRVLALLREHGQRATFFVIGRKALRYPDILQEIRDQGHEIGLHGLDHEWLYCFKTRDDVVADVRAVQAAVASVCKEPPTLFRPPLGIVSPRTASGAERAGVRLVAWSARGFDGVGRRTPRATLSRVKRGLAPGTIVLLHDAAERDDFVPSSIEALPELLHYMDQRGFRSRPLSEVLSEPGEHALIESTEP